MDASIIASECFVVDELECYYWELLVFYKFDSCFGLRLDPITVLSMGKKTYNHRKQRNSFNPNEVTYSLLQIIPSEIELLGNEK